MTASLRNIAAAVLALPYRLRLGRLGRRPRLFAPILLTGASRISLGDDVRVEQFAALSTGRGRLTVGNGCEVRSFARLEGDDGHLTLGDRCSVNPFCLLNGHGGLIVGSDVRIASHTVILSSSHRYDDPTLSVLSQGVAGQPTVIEDDVWFGSHCVVVGGVRIGAHSIIGAGAVVTADIPPYSIAAGVPARVIRTRTP